MADPPVDPAALVATMPFAVLAGITIESAVKEAVVGHVDWAEERCTIGGLVHGGALMTLADSLGAVAAFLHLPEGAGTATVTSDHVAAARLARRPGHGHLDGHQRRQAVHHRAHRRGR